MQTKDVKNKRPNLADHALENSRLRLENEKLRRQVERLLRDGSR